MTPIRKNPLELVHVGDTVQVWIGTPNEPESELVSQCSTLLVDQLIATPESELVLPYSTLLVDQLIATLRNVVPGNC